ncbi:MAG: YqzK family protein [Firmicutes bacterium]|nr:YqzK family protein [Bacillota bacterium]
MFFSSKKLTRLLLVFLLLLIVFPLIHYYALRLLHPEMVSFREPRGMAIKVAASRQQPKEKLHTMTRFLYFLHDFYQNGL